MKKKHNWDVIKNQKPEETVRYRNVHEDQQLERSELDKPETMTSRTIMAACISLLVLLVIWVTVSAIQMGFSGSGELELNPSPENTWMYVPEHYVNVSDQTDVISVAAYEELVQRHKDIQSGKIRKPDNPGDPPQVDEQIVYTEIDHRDGSERRQVTVPAGAILPDGVSRATERTELILTVEEAGNYIAAVNADYQNRLTAWQEYQAATANPKDAYTKQVAHYRNRNDFTQYIKEDEYQRLLDDYSRKVGSVKEGSKAAHLASVPFLPFDPEDFYGEYQYGIVDIREYNPQVYLTQEQSEALQAFRAMHQLPGPEGAAYTALGGMVYFDEEPPAELEPVFEKMNVQVGSRAISYRNVLDGTVISYAEYDRLVCQYQADIVSFKEQYQAHREQYHPDDIDGTKKVFSMAPTKVKVILSLFVSLICFAIVERVMYANLQSRNVTSDTTDINQYHNDQHIALPEEIQENYDLFPDVGAHSAVQVSSMISHMALLNKGLKKVQVAVRADKDIRDEDGNIEYYKGEILEDGNGNPITKPMPLIDTDFMEALFDASKAPTDKRIRKYYDASKIPYNPDGSNRGKLGKYGTWADLINDDWELPLYEPQRPAGVYVVDTAPVNTMV